MAGRNDGGGAGVRARGGAPGLGTPAMSIAPAGPRRVPVGDLLGDQREVIIEHGAEAYRLRLTSKGKLILTK